MSTSSPPTTSTDSLDAIQHEADVDNLFKGKEDITA